MNYTDSLQYLYDRLPVFHRVGGAAYKPGLDNTIRLMTALHNPQLRYRTIHVAGTNGKGSVSHFLAAILQSAGYKTGLYTSPHLVDFGERIRVNGKMIEKQYVINFVEQHRNLFADIEPSFFEATMTMAFDYFAHCEVDIAVVEVGLGGRLDSTNIISPELSVITNISLDHVAFLGDTLEKIAGEKAGIIKTNTPVIIGEALPETRTVFEQKALEMKAPLFFAEEGIKINFVEYIENKMRVIDDVGKYYLAGLNGLYQLKNIATVLTAVEQLNQLGFDISASELMHGLENVVEITGLQGRWQVLQKNPTVLADTGHNVGGIRFIVEQLKSQTYKTLHVVIGMVNDKDVSTVLALLPADAKYYFTQADIMRALPSEELMQKAESVGLKGMSFLSVNEAVNIALKNADENDLVFIGGSNFVVGEALALLQ
jgi:dihydrofolate synthase/folylpolyglutamate synthase